MKTRSERESNCTLEACKELKRREKERWRVMGGRDVAVGGVREEVGWVQVGGTGEGGG